MKKLTLFVMLFMFIGLVGCGNSEKRVAVSDNPADEIKTALNLDSVKNGVSLNKDLNKEEKSYVDVKIASDAKSTLFYSLVNLDEYLNDDFKGVNLKALTFSNNLISTDISSFFQELNNENYGVKATTVKEFASSSTNGTLYGKLAETSFVTFSEEFKAKESGNTLVVVYLPVYCIYHEGNQDYVKAYYLVPVYYNFVVTENGNVTDTNLEGMTYYQINLNDNGLLPSKSE